MEFFSSTRTTKGFQAGNRPIANNVLRIEHDDPKQRFGHSLTTIRHERSDAFNDAITRFLYEMDLNEFDESDLRGLVHGCMEHREIAALREILPLYMGFDYKILRIEGPVSTDGWETLVKATKEAPLFVEALAISGFNLDYSKGRFFFEALGQMPALRTLHLGPVGVESAILFSEEWHIAGHEILLHVARQLQRLEFDLAHDGLTELLRLGDGDLAEVHEVQLAKLANFGQRRRSLRQRPSRSRASGRNTSAWGHHDGRRYCQRLGISADEASDTCLGQLCQQWTPRRFLPEAAGRSVATKHDLAST